MKRFLLPLCFFVTFALFGQAPEFEWAKQLGGLNGETGYAITTDKLGNIYVTGNFQGVTDFDPSMDTFNLTSSSTMYNISRDIFVAKYDTEGQLLWAASFGDIETDRGSAITTDTLGNVYITGSFRGTIDFDPGPEVYTLSASINFSDIFILKLDANGSFIWVRGMGGSGGTGGSEIVVDIAGNVYTIGGFALTTDFDPGPGVYNLTANGFNDIFISKLNSDGNFEWAKAIGGENIDLGNAIAIDKFNNVYVTGVFVGSVDFDPGPEEFILTATGTTTWDMFISKLSGDGEFIWARAIGDSLSDTRGNGIAIDDMGAVYTTGGFDLTVDFDPGPDTSNLTAIDEYDIFILKLDTDGNYIWAKSAGGEGIQGGGSIVLDKNKNVYIAGTFRGAADFDPGPDTFSLSTPSLVIRNTYVLKLDGEGDYVWAGSLFGVVDNICTSMAIDRWSNIYTTGNFKGITDFNPDTSSYEIMAFEATDIFIHKMSQACNAAPVINNNNIFSTCTGDSITLMAEMPYEVADLAYFWNSGETEEAIVVAPDSLSIYTLTASYTSDTMTCITSTSVEITVFDAIAISVSSDLEACVEEEITLEAEGGISYFWSTGDTTSLITIIAEEDQSYSVSVTDINGCMGIDSVEVFVNPLSDTTYLGFTSCDSLLVGTSEFTFFDQNGCDSIVVESVAFVSIPEAPVAPVDIVIQENEPPFQISILEVPNATSYLWTVPVGVNILSGQGTNSIIVDWNGSTTTGSICVSAINECGSSAIDCMEVSVEIIDAVEDVLEKNYILFPNPVDEVLRVIFKEKGAYEIVLFDVLGRKMKSFDSYGSSVEIAMENLISGTYWLRISWGARNNKMHWERVIN